MNLNDLIDRFVNTAIESGAVFAPIEYAPWVDDLEKKLSKRFPASFRSLLTRYQFAPFRIGSIEFFANTGLNDEDEMAVAIFRDKFIAQTTQAHGFIQFARCSIDSYDPICFDTRKRAHNDEYPIVSINHEQILSFDRIGKPTTKAASFYQFVLGVIETGA
jgi:hypothetical protein